MSRIPNRVSARGVITTFLILINAIVLKSGYVLHEEWYLLLPLSSSLLLASLIIRKRRRHGKNGMSEKNAALKSETGQKMPESPEIFSV